MSADRETLLSTGCVYVTHTAARAYQDATRLPDLEEARRLLTLYLCDARRVEPEAPPPERWRIRSRAAGLDIGAHVTRDGSLAVVVHVRVRGYEPRRSR